MKNHSCGANHISATIYVINNNVNWVFQIITVDNEKTFMFSTNCDLHGMDNDTYSKWFIDKWTHQFQLISKAMPYAIKCKQCRNADMQKWQVDFGKLCTMCLSEMENEGIKIIPCHTVPYEIMLELQIISNDHDQSVLN